MSEIKNQVKLPLPIAFGVVLQGIRIRFGRSVVTITGVVLGIAFLMSILTGQLIKQGVSEESALRVELKRMHSFLTAEIGSVDGRTIRVIEDGEADRRERRFLGLLKEEGAQLGEGAVAEPVATIVVGSATLPGDQETKLAGQVIAFTRRPPAESGMRPGTSVVSLDRELKPDEVARLAAEVKQQRSRTIWIIVISLLVTVIGISNAMLMSVTERFREIGTMKCLGALSAFIRQIFFIESSLVGLVGSLVGSVLGALVSIVIYSATYGVGMTIGTLPAGQMLVYLAGSTVAGVVLSIIAAIYPASFASRMVPAHALRSSV